MNITYHWHDWKGKRVREPENAASVTIVFSEDDFTHMVTLRLPLITGEVRKAATIARQSIDAQKAEAIHGTPSKVVPDPAP